MIRLKHEVDRKKKKGPCVDVESMWLNLIGGQEKRAASKEKTYFGLGSVFGHLRREESAKSRTRVRRVEDVADDDGHVSWAWEGQESAVAGGRGERDGQRSTRRVSGEDKQTTRSPPTGALRPLSSSTPPSTSTQPPQPRKNSHNVDNKHAHSLCKEDAATVRGRGTGEYEGDMHLAGWDWAWASTLRYSL